MRKIPTLLVRDPDDRAHVLDEVAPGCEWVLAGEGVATRKYDGTCVQLDEGEAKWWARREVKPDRPYPPNYIAEEHDLTTGKTVGWEPIEQSSFFKFWREAFDAAIQSGDSFPFGTFELCGPKINGNPERFGTHRLIRHANAERFEGYVSHTVSEVKQIILGISAWSWEGLVWHHPDGRMAKLKVRDLGPTSSDSETRG